MKKRINLVLESDGNAMRTYRDTDYNNIFCLYCLQKMFKVGKPIYISLVISDKPFDDSYKIEHVVSQCFEVETFEYRRLTFRGFLVSIKKLGFNLDKPLYLGVEV